MEAMRERFVRVTGQLLDERPEVALVLVSWGASHDYVGEGRTHHAPGDVAAGLAYVRLSEHPNARPLENTPGRITVLRRGTLGVVLVEPYLAGTSSAVVAEALSGVPHRLLALGVGQPDLRRYGAFEHHQAAQGLDPESLRGRISGFVGRSPAAAS